MHKTREKNHLGAVISAILLTGGLTACGGGGSGGSSTPTNTAPTITVSEDVAQREQTEVTLTATASDADGDTIAISWAQTDGPDLDLGTIEGETLTFTLPDIEENEAYVFTATADDGEDTATGDVSVTATINGVPVVTVDAPEDAREGETITLAGSAIDPDGNDITGYTWTQTNGPDLGMGTPTGQNLEIDLPNVDNDTPYTFQLEAADDVETGTAEVSFTALANRAPTLAVTAPGTVNELATVEMSAEATDEEGDGLSYEWELLTADTGIALSSTNAAATQFDAPLIDENAVTVEFRVTATDDAAFPESASETVTVSIAQEALILFVQRTADGDNLYRVDTSGNRTALFISDAFWELQNYWISPDRKKVAITTDGKGTMSNAERIEIIDIETGFSVSAAPSVLTTPSSLFTIYGSPAWSPDSTKLAYRADPTADGVYDLLVVNADGGNARIVATPFVDDRSRITGYQLGSDSCWDSDPDCGNGDDTDVTADVLDFQWSPDSEWLAFRMQATPSVAGKDSQTSTELKTVRIPDGEIFTISRMFVQRVTDGDPATGPDCTGAATWCWEADTDATLDYHPDAWVDDYAWKTRSDGQWLAYRSHERRNSNDTLNLRIWISDAEGNQHTQLAEFEATGVHRISVRDWAWSPDGTYIAWTDRLIDTSGATMSHRFMTAPFTPNVTAVNGNNLLTNLALSPHTLPDGNTSQAGIDGEVTAFAWSPDNRALAFTGRVRHPAVEELYVIDRDWTAWDDGIDALSIPGDLFRDDYNCGDWDRAFYGAVADGFAADGRWDTDGYCNKNGLEQATPNDTPDGGIEGGGFHWTNDGSALIFGGSLRMQNLNEIYRWDVATQELDVLSHATRDERDNLVYHTVPSSSDETADSASGVNTDSRYGIPEAGAWFSHGDIVGGSSPPEIVYRSDERFGGIRELWMSRPDGTPLLLSDLFRDSDGDGIPDSDHTGAGGSPDGLPDGDVLFSLSLGGTRFVYMAQETNHRWFELVFVDASDPAGTRTYLSVPVVEDQFEGITGFTLAFGDGTQKVVNN